MSGPPRLAVVGSVALVVPDGWQRAERLIEQAIERLGPGVLISGGAPGIDSLAEVVGAKYGYTEAGGNFLIFRPRHQRWKPDGFADRNLLIAEECTHLLRIYDPTSKTYGSGWTADRAEELGADVVRRPIGPVAVGVPT